MQTLERLHAELGGQILENKTEALRLVDSMRHVEAVIKMLDPTYNLRRIAVKRRQPNPWVQSVSPSTGCPADGHRAIEGKGDLGADLNRRQYKEARQSRAGGPDRDRSDVPAESQGEGCPARH